MQKNKLQSALLFSYIPFLHFLSVKKLNSINLQEEEKELLSFHTSQGKALFCFEILWLTLTIIAEILLRVEAIFGVAVVLNYITSVVWLYIFTMLVLGLISVIKNEKRILLIPFNRRNR